MHNSPVLKSGQRADRAAAAVVASGGILVFPTDTVYAIGCDPFNPGALAKLFSSKGRGTKAVPVLCASLADAESLVHIDGLALDLARKHWPGALTIVAPLRRNVPRLLDQGLGTLGVRVPGAADCVRLVRGCGGLLVGTSANRSGDPSCRTVEEAVSQLGESVDLYIDGGERSGSESTVVKIEGGEIIILRKGSVGV